jgi:hypothetical protein
MPSVIGPRRRSRILRGAIVGLLPALCVVAGGRTLGQTPAPADEGAGALLYTTHCVGCHTAQVHWRSGKRVTNWASLLAEVRRWQNSTGLAWSDDDIDAVARHLNALYYHLPAPDRVAGAARMPSAGVD